VLCSWHAGADRLHKSMLQGAGRAVCSSCS
jgi:hypothetical protein